MKRKHPIPLLLRCGICVVLLLSCPARGETVKYSYDAAGRLIGAYYGSGATISYVYDPAGNLLRQVITQFTDTDGDGMDDDWERSQFGDLSRDGTGDFDGDGQTDLREYMAGTDPRNSQSVLKVVPLTASPLSGFSMQWSSVSGKYYRVQYNDTLSPGDWQNLGGDVLATGPVSSKTDTGIAGSAKRFYRVVPLF